MYPYSAVDRVEYGFLGCFLIPKIVKCKNRVRKRKAGDTRA